MALSISFITSSLCYASPTGCFPSCSLFRAFFLICPVNTSRVLPCTATKQTQPLYNIYAKPPRMWLSKLDLGTALSIGGHRQRSGQKKWEANDHDTAGSDEDQKWPEQQLRRHRRQSEPSPSFGLLRTWPPRRRMCAPTTAAGRCASRVATAPRARPSTAARGRSSGAAPAATSAPASGCRAAAGAARRAKTASHRPGNSLG